LREGLAKDKGGTLEERVGRIEERYNNTYHTTIIPCLTRHGMITMKWFPRRTDRRVVMHSFVLMKVGVEKVVFLPTYASVVPIIAVPSLSTAL
jgi:hypothetical protein